MHRVLYKHLPSRFADGLIARGEVRVGTLYEYRDDEKHGEGVLDRLEGKRETFLDVDYMSLNGENDHPFVREFIGVGEGSSVVLQDVSFHKTHNSPDCWLYCVSTSDDEVVGANLSDDYDACVRIDDPYLFMLALGRFFTQPLQPLTFCMGWWQCQYIGRKVEYENRVHPVMLKESCFSHQQESRAIFFPINWKPEPIIVQIPELTQYVTRLR
ncbi:hypothetical protein GCM10017767_06380 [Halomonas urumqiensis]|nr:hypothetical protein GCM10017767_06380 [Halomonas urumqiensis]